MVTIALDREVIATVSERLQRGFDVADVKARLGHGKTDFRHRGFGLGLPAVRLEKDGGGHLAMKPCIFDGSLGFSVQPCCVRIALAANIRCHRAFQLGFPQLFKSG